MTTWILAVLALFIVQTLIPAALRASAATGGMAGRMKFALGSRDVMPETGVLYARADRALKNMQEALPVFLGLALLIVALDIEIDKAVLGAQIFFFARLLYVPVYMSGIFGIRSVAWGAGLVGLVLMLLDLCPAM